MLIHSVSTLYSLGNDASGRRCNLPIPSYCELIMESIAFYYMLSNIRYHSERFFENQDIPLVVLCDDIRSAVFQR